MWKYTHTDEMYHSLTNKDELFHSNTYQGQDFSDGIKHFKYMFKRKGPNGKWIYVYKKTDNVSLTTKGISKSGSFYVKTKGTPDNRYGTYEHTDPDGTKTIHKVVKGKRLLTKTHKRADIGATTWHKTTEVGLARQGVDKVKKKINKTVAKGKKAVNKLLKKKKKK